MIDWLAEAEKLTGEKIRPPAPLPPDPTPEQERLAEWQERAAILEYDAELPRHVAEGLASLFLMQRPSNLRADRWQQLIDDAGRLADSGLAAKAYQLGWADLDLWGCSPGFARRLDRDGLVMAIGGRRVLRVTPECAEISTSGAHILRFRPGKPLYGAETLWSAVAA
jgi:hypothetical protein|tara:strand:- start:22005 stop:22505 length:501 start_codon:yes stop_codon:yes gene_type:complete